MYLEIRRDLASGLWELIDARGNRVLKTFHNYQQAYTYKIRLSWRGGY